jgi:Domain of unknown function (DUF4357)
MTGKSIRLFLAEGTAHGLISAEIVNWTGRVLIVNRSDLDKLAQRTEARRPGVYLLAGADPDKPSKERIYVGESENVLARLVQHDRKEEKEFWTRTALVTSKDENLTKSHIRFLESCLIHESRLAGRVVLDNGNVPDPAPLPEADVADMEYFLSQIRLLLPVLGFNLMQRLARADQTEGDNGREEESPLFEMTPIGLQAQMRFVDGEFVVLKGSTARKKGIASWTSYRSLREQLVEDGTLVDADNPDHFVFARDYAFASPSAAAAIIVAGNQNGWLVWKHKPTGKTYKDWQASRLEAAGVSDDSLSGEQTSA